MGKQRHPGRWRPVNDPRKLGGAIVGPGGPHDRAGVVIDTRNAILLENTNVSTVDPEGARGQRAIAMQLSGRVNRTTDRAEVLFLFGTDGAAAIITELIGLLSRASGPEYAASFLADMQTRMATLKAEGNLSPVPPDVADGDDTPPPEDAARPD